MSRLARPWRPGRRPPLASRFGRWITAPFVSVLAVIPLSPAVMPQRGTGTPLELEALTPSLRRDLEVAGGELADGGRKADVESVLFVLDSLGLPERAKERLERKWTADLERRKRNWKKDKAREHLEKAAATLEKELLAADENVQPLLARLLHTLDDQHPEANRLLGNSQHRGVWMTPEKAVAARGRERLAEDHRWSSSLRFDVEYGDSELQLIESLGLQGMRKVTILGVSIHSRLPTERVRRILAEALRAGALSYAAFNGKREVPRFAPASYVILPEGRFAEALKEADENGGISENEYEALRDHSTFDDHRGWYTCRWRSEAETESLILFDQSRAWLGWTAQPVLLAGHVNWAALRQLGTLIPQLSWSDNRFVNGTDVSSMGRAGTSKRESGLLRTASRGLYGTRRYLMLLAQRGEDPKWSRSMVDEVGKIQNVDLLKATLIAEYLMETGDFAELLAGTRGKARRVDAFEEALGRRLPAFEAEWRDWLLAEDEGLLQRLRRNAVEATEEQLEILEALHEVRSKALAEPYPAADRDLWLDQELSKGAKAHATYLTRHTEQQSVWPGAHEEYADREGFSPAGSWAGNHSVIHLGTKKPIDAWMATFYHRLPLLDPGLLGVGIERTGRVVVADVLSLVAPVYGENWVVWPPDKAEDIPLSFYPELPQPVPDRLTEELGYPITLQVFGTDIAPDAQFEFELRREGARGERVPFYLSSPITPLNAVLAPPGAFCLIPHEHLQPRTRYFVRAQRSSSESRSYSWSFTTGT